MREDAEGQEQDAVTRESPKKESGKSTRKGEGREEIGGGGAVLLWVEGETKRRDR